MENKDNFAILAKRLKQIRTERGMTQKEFAQEMGFTSTTLSAYENNLKKPSLDLMLEVAKKCDVSLDWLCGLSDKNEKDKQEYKTYSDILKVLIKIDSVLPTSINLFKENDNNILCDYNFCVIKKGIFFLDHTFELYLEQWEKFKNLLNENNIDYEIYTACIEKLLRDSNKPIYHSVNLEDLD